MLNQVVLVGRLTKNVELEESEGGKKFTVMQIAIPRSFKNADGEYDADFIDCLLWNVIAENTVEYCKKGDIVGVKGRLERLNNEKLRVVAEKVTFLSSRKEKEEE